jgi:uncharacterized protein YggE
MKHLRLSALALAPALALAGPAAAARPASTLQVGARATVSRAPDRVYIELGVRTEARRPTAATAQNAVRVAAVVAAVRNAAGPGARLATADYSVAPQYQYHNDGKAPTLTGYVVTNILRVRLDELTRIGAVIDAASGAGANVQQTLRFALRDPEAARLQALAQAAQRARQAARALAAALGLRIVRIVTVRGGGTSVVPPGPVSHPLAIRMERMAPATPIESGRIRVSADVDLIVAVAPR